MSLDDLCANCGHERRHHVYHAWACRPGFVCQAECEAFQGVAEVHPAVAATARRIAEWIREQGDVYQPILMSGDVACKHGSFVFLHEDCGECSMIQLADDIDAGKWQTKGANQ